jgi:hypothetical protein
MPLAVWKSLKEVAGYEDTTLFALVGAIEVGLCPSTVLF